MGGVDCCLKRGKDLKQEDGIIDEQMIKSKEDKVYCTKLRIIYDRNSSDYMCKVGEIKLELLKKTHFLNKIHKISFLLILKEPFYYNIENFKSNDYKDNILMFINEDSISLI